MDFETIVGYLKESDPQRVRRLWNEADQVRRQHVGDDVHLRGLVEISNWCVRDCSYCGLRVGNRPLARYRMTIDEIVECAHRAAEFGYGTVVLQAGEDPVLSEEFIAELIRRIRSEVDLAITLSLGERSDEDLDKWRQAGADRYLVRFETSNPELFARIRSNASGVSPRDRVEMLRSLRRLGYEVGSGCLIGIPGQSWEDLARDVSLLAELDLDMIGCGPFVPNPDTPLGRGEVPELVPLGPEDQVPADETTTLKTLALARLVCPRANIPATTALATISPEHGRAHGLACGANIVMPNVTPLEYRELYAIYPNKAGYRETAEATHAMIGEQLAALGRSIGRGRGDSPNRMQRSG